METKKRLAWLLILMMVFACFCAYAEGTEPKEEEEQILPVAEATDGVLIEARKKMTLSGTVVAGETKAVFAPFGGTVGELSVQAGDIVSAGDTLFVIGTDKVFAPCDGTVGSLGLQVGDESAQVVERYGALMYVEPSSRFLIETDTKNAYAADENLFINVGEPVYIGSRTNSERVGVGFVKLVDGSNFTVEVTDGNLIMDDSVSIFRSANFAVSSRIGSGTTTRMPSVAITADGSVFKVHVTQGQSVRRGQILLEMVGGSLGYNPYPSDHVYAETDAIVASVDISAGGSLSKGQSMATLYPLSSLQISASVGEMDIKNVLIGDSVRIELAGFQDEAPLTGTIRSISGMNASDAAEGEAMYALRIDFPATPLARLGMSANVYLNEK